MKTLNHLINKATVLIIIALFMQGDLYQSDAQESLRSTIVPIMKITNLERSEIPVHLDVLKIDIRVVGQVASTTLDMTFSNKNNRVLEGEFNFPLGEGQTVSRFALDINGVLREGVIVEKEHGRQTFEAVVRRGIDPGLLEMTQGNNFRARIFPLPANGSRRVVLAFEQELTDKGSNDLYVLPLGITDPVSRFSVHAEIIQKEVRIDQENNELSNLALKRWRDSFVADLELDNYTPDKQIALGFPHQGDRALVLTAPMAGHPGSTYFYVTVRPEVHRRSKVLPSKITLLWDNSNSARSRDTKKEIDLLEAYFQKIGNLQIDLVPFNIRFGETRTFTIENGNWNELRSVLESMVYDGGTSLGHLDLSSFRSDEILLFSDGMSNFGPSEPVLSATPVYAINTSLITDHGALTYIAQRTGGIYINLSKQTIEESLSMLTYSNYHLISAFAENGDMTEIYPSMPCQFVNSLSLAGIMKGNAATLVLNFGFGSTIVYAKRINLTADSSAEELLLRRLWATKKLAELSLNEEKNLDAITSLGKEYGIVTRNTSWIVLENISDYLQHHILPPVEMRDEYYKQLSASEKKTAENVSNHIDYVVGLSGEQSKWWNTKFPVLPLTDDSSQSRGHNQPQEGLILAGVADSMDFARTMPMMMLSEEADMQEAVSLDYHAGDQSFEKTKSLTKADIQLSAWDPQTPYLKVLQYSATGQEYPTYLKLKDEYGSMPAFYMDASDFFREKGKYDIAVLILSNLAELKLEAPQLLRVLGKKLLKLDQKNEAVRVFEKVMKLKGEEPQSYRDLGLAYMANGNFQQAITTLYEVVKREWDVRFPGIELIVMNEINQILAAHAGLDHEFMDPRLLKEEPVDIRVVLTWDTDNCDMDLWVTEPSGEKCFYQHQLTIRGGKISNDFTGGYGPEEYMIKTAAAGEYLIQANYFGNRSQTFLAPVTLHLAFYTNYGKPGQQQQEVTIRLENQKDVIDVGKFTFGAPN
jgi:hypothetical protein